jgi:hypothetical protein
MIAGPIIGLWSLVAMWTKAPSEDAFFKRLRRPLGLGYWLLFSLVAAFLLSFVGGVWGNDVRLDFVVRSLPDCGARSGGRCEIVGSLSRA